MSAKLQQKRKNATSPPVNTSLCVKLNSSKPPESKRAKVLHLLCLNTKINVQQTSKNLPEVCKASRSNRIKNAFWRVALREKSPKAPVYEVSQAIPKTRHAAPTVDDVDDDDDDDDEEVQVRSRSDTEGLPSALRLHCSSDKALVLYKSREILATIPRPTLNLQLHPRLDMRLEYAQLQFLSNFFLPSTLIKVHTFETTHVSVQSVNAIHDDFELNLFAPQSSGFRRLETGQRARRPVSVGHVRNWSETTTLFEEQGDAQPLPAATPALQTRFRSKHFRDAGLSHAGLEGQVSQLEMLLFGDEHHLLTDHVSKQSFADRLARARGSIFAKGLSAQRTINRQSREIQMLNATYAALNARLNEQIGITNQQIFLYGQLFAQCQAIQHDATARLNEQIRMTNHQMFLNNKLSAQNQAVQHDAATRLSHADTKYQRLYKYTQDREQRWQEARVESEHEKANLEAKLSQCQQDMEQITGLVQLTNQNNDVYEQRAIAAEQEVCNLKQEIYRAKAAILCKSDEREDAEQALAVSQKLHVEDKERLRFVSSELEELREKAVEDEQAHKTDIEEAKCALAAEQELLALLQDQNALLRRSCKEGFRKHPLDDAVATPAISTPDVDSLLDTNEQLQDLTTYLQRRLAYAEANMPCEDSKAQSMKIAEQDQAIARLLTDKRGLEGKLLKEEMETGAMTSELNIAEQSLEMAKEHMEAADAAAQTAQKDAMLWQASTMDIMRDRLTAAHLIRADEWLCDRLCSQIESKNTEIEALRTTQQELQQKLYTTTEAGTIMLNLAHEVVFNDRNIMGKTILFAEANHRERNEAYAKTEAFEKRFARELERKPLVVGPVFVESFDELAPEGFDELRKVFLRWSMPKSEDFENVVSISGKHWYDYTPNDVNRLRVLHGLHCIDEVETESDVCISKGSKVAKTTSHSQDAQEDDSWITGSGTRPAAQDGEEEESWVTGSGTRPAANLKEDESWVTETDESNLQLDDANEDKQSLSGNDVEVNGLDAFLHELQAAATNAAIPSTFDVALFDESKVDAPQTGETLWSKDCFW